MKESDRHIIDNFIQAIDAPLVHRAIHVGISYPELRTHPSSYDNETNYPNWLNPKGYINVISEIYTSNVWKTIVNHVGSELTNRVVEARSIGKISEQSIPTELYIINNAFMGRALEEALIGAAIDTEKKAKFRIDKMTEVIAKKFKGPPQNPEQLLTRMQILIPNPQSNPPQDKILLDTLYNENAFTRGQGGWCPATQLTELMLDAWGWELGTNKKYQRRVVQTVQKNPSEQRTIFSI